MAQQVFENLDLSTSNEKIADLFSKTITNFYPKIRNINKHIALDLGFLYIYRQLESDEERDALVNFWREKSPAQTVQLHMGEFHYRPFIDFIYLDKIMNGLFIETTLEQMMKFKQLNFCESCAILSDLERYYVVPLSEMDVKIIEAIRNSLLEKKCYTNEYLSQILKVRPNYISRRIGYLRNNAYFRLTGTVNYPKIGLTLYIILIESSFEYNDKIQYYFSSAYTRIIRRCPNQRFDYIISLTIPKEYENDLFNFLLQLKEQKIIRSYYCDEVESISQNLNFTYYMYSKRPTIFSIHKPGFYIDWFKERILTMTDNAQNMHNNIFHRFYFKGDKIDFSITDLKIMSIFKNDLDSSVRILAKRLSLTWDETNYHLEKIKNLLFPMILLYYMGLNQSVILFFEKISNEHFNSLERILLRMPQTFSYLFRKGGAIITVDLMYGAHRLNDLICEMLPDLKNTQFFLASKTSGIFRPLPYKYYDEEKCKWTFPSDFFLFNKIQ